MKNMCRIFHPVVLGAWFVLDLYVRNFADVAAQEILAPLLIVPVFVLVAYLLILAILRKPDHSGLITSFALVVFFSYGFSFSMANKLADSLAIEALADAAHVHAVSQNYFLSSVALFLVFASVLIAWVRRDLAKVTRSVNFVSMILLLFASARILLAVVGSSASSSAPNVDQADGPAVIAKDSPDIYFLIFDRYPNQATLKSSYSFDNQAFLEQLETRNFVVNNQSHCNYPRSLPSLHATLNMAYHSKNVSSNSLSQDFQRGHAVGRELRSRGYTYYHLGSWYVPTRECQLADVNIFSFLHGPPGMSEFHVALLKNTPVYPFLNYSLDREASDRHEKITQLQFDNLEKFSKRSSPKFVFAHILLPHPPLIFDRDGNRVARRDYGSKAAFLDQLHYANTAIVRLVDVIRAESTSEPVIILQADEGPYLREKDRDQLTGTQYKIRAGILNAWHVPAKFREELQVPESTINTFPTLLNLLFEKDYSPLPDRYYLWEDLLEHPHESDSVYHFEEITLPIDDEH